MLTIGGLLLGAVLTAPGHVVPAEPIDPTAHRVTTAHRETTPGLRDPFAVPAHQAEATTGRRAPRPSETDLRDPFAPALRREPVVTTPAGPTADLHPPFEPAPTTTRPPFARASEPHPELRDPFAR
jgi:hypothetical protein